MKFLVIFTQRTHWEPSGDIMQYYIPKYSRTTLVVLFQQPVSAKINVFAYTSMYFGPAHSRCWIAVSCYWRTGEQTPQGVPQLTQVNCAEASKRSKWSKWLLKGSKCSNSNLFKNKWRNLWVWTGHWSCSYGKAY